MNQIDDTSTTSATKRTVRLPTTARPELKGKRYASLIRCSSLGQADTSPEGQKLINDAFCSENGMQWVTDIWAEGVSGSQTFNRQDLEDVLEAHRRDPFDIIIVHDLSRLTRGGIRHGNVVEDTFRKAGLKVVSSTDFIADGPEGDLIKSVKHYSNQLQARGISLAVARGLSQSLAKSSRPAAGRNPYALDRQYVGPDAKPRIVVRWEGRTQIWLKPGTNEEVGRRERPNKLSGGEKKQRRRNVGRIFRGYVKQADETSRLVQGSNARHDVLVWMFNAYDVWKWGYHRIAQHLNQTMRTPSPEGDRWTLRTVKSVLFNAIYLGIEVRHKYTGALYNMVTEAGTVAVQVDQDQLEREKRTTVPQTERPREDWLLVTVPHLEGVLPSPLREIAAERIMRQFDTSIPQHPRKGKALHTGEGRHKQLNSPFVLTHVLHSKQTGHSMRGETVNRKLVGGPTQYRYYFDGGAAIRGEKGLHIRRVPAEPLEAAVLGVVKEVLGDSEGLRARVQDGVARLLRDEPDEGQKKESLLEEQESLSSRLRQAYKLLGKVGVEAIEAEVAKDSSRLAEVMQELKALDRSRRPEQIDAGQVTKRVLERLDAVVEKIADMPHAELKQLLAAMVDDLTVDLETGDVTLELVLTDWMQPSSSEPTDNAGVRLGCTSPWTPTAEAKCNSLRVSLGRWSCLSVRRRCYECSRRAA